MTPKVRAFLLLAFGLDWGLALVGWLMGIRVSSPAFMVLALGYMAGPALAAVIVQRWHGEGIKAPLGIRFTWNRWFTLAWLGPVALVGPVIAFSVLMPNVRLSLGLEGILARASAVLTPAQLAEMKRQLASLPVHPFWLGLLQALVAGPTINAVAAFGEELGWRGFLQREWRHLGFWPSSMRIGAIWGLWHAPLIVQGYNYPHHPVSGVIMMMLFCGLLAPLLAYVRLKGRSTLAAAVGHGSLNAVATLPTLVLLGGHEFLSGFLGLAGFGALALVNLALWRFAAPETGEWDGALAGPETP